MEWYCLLSTVLSGNFSFVSVIVYLLSSLAVIFLTLPIHEFAHGYAATKLGDYTPRYQGRLTLNPFAHIDYIGAMCILLFGFGWAKPVQVNARNFKNAKVGMAITAFAGPLANIVLAFVSLVLANVCQVIPINTEILIYIYMFFNYIATINIYLAVFNLIPIPPLDGSRLLSAFLPNKYYYSLMRYERYFSIIILALLWIGVLDVPLGFLSNAIRSALQFAANLPFVLIF
ncbi:MAG: site-2 protease family protein [Ruminococcaceae bacterium]|nr:site-2 protease family protein [Oscillospiraceae bacterium]